MYPDLPWADLIGRAIQVRAGKNVVAAHRSTKLSEVPSILRQEFIQIQNRIRNDNPGRVV